MPARHPNFSASEAAASLMSRIQADERDRSTTTVQLAKGHINSSSPARSSTPGSWSSFDAVESSRSPDSRVIPPVLHLLQGVGVVEILEQDDRPTFIVDLMNSANFAPGPLQILYYNAALRSSQSVYELLSVEEGTNGSNNEDFGRFKTWATSFVRKNEALDVSLPTCSYGGIDWSCLTIRRRFRFISGNNIITPMSATPTSPTVMAGNSTGATSAGSRKIITGDAGHTPTDVANAETDYFGNVGDVDQIEARQRAASEPKEKPDSLVLAMENHEEEAGWESVSSGTIKASFDWTKISISSDLPDHILLCRAVDWASTPLGPIEQWPADLRTMSNLMMGSPHPAALWWGPDLIAVYNEAYAEIAGLKHPRLLGMMYREAWHEIWDEVEGIFMGAYRLGQATMKSDDRLFMERNGFVEETYFSWSIIPIIGYDGSIVALYNPAFENTRRKVNERRMLTLREVGEKTSEAKDVKGFWSLVRQGLEYNEYDIPFALIYSVSHDLESEASSIHSGAASNPPQVSLEGSIGVPDDHHAAVPIINLRSSGEGFGPYMRESLAQQGVPVVLSTEDGTLPEALIAGIEWKGFGDPCRTVVVFPIHPTTGGDSVVGFLVTGANPRRPYDDDYKLFINLLSRQLATSMASVVLFEEEIKRGERAARLAALDRQELSMQLRLRTQEAVESEYKFTRMAEFAPVGMFIANGDGQITYCNDMWWEISRHPKSADTVASWMLSIEDEDRPGVEAVWTNLVAHKEAITHEFRFKCPKHHDNQTLETWVLMSAYPEKDDDGSLKSIFGCITDISQQKWAEAFQKQRKEEAVELKRQQENFIDITSHEMRNPLSAILQCADEIAVGLNEYRFEGAASYDPGKLAGLLDNCQDAANTISLCASHQKRIVDDILTLSKLDSQLLLVTPVDEQPIMVVQNVLKMFESELNAHDILGEFRLEQSYYSHEVDWVRIDPSRLRQVLINLMTNAIKFTQGQEERSIVISLGASRDLGEPGVSGMQYFPSRSPEKADLINDPEWGDGDEINLHLAVRDTGPGLSEDEKKLLFQRFSQTSPRTHVQYGGSGLGLFISRILSELQGGQIGVVSAKGIGSTFLFYIKSRRSSKPVVDASTSLARSPIKVPEPASAGQTSLQYSTKKAKPSPRPLLVLPPTVQSAQPPKPTQPKPLAAKTALRQPLDVLIVEDNLVNQKVLERQLRLSGNTTYVANHGGEALQVLRRSRFWRAGDPLPRHRDTSSPAHSQSSGAGNSETDGSMDDGGGGGVAGINISVILMDLEMPVMDGMTCARKIRELEASGTLLAHIPIIAVTAYARPEQIRDAKGAGIDGVISKPFRVPELLPKIEELVTKYDTWPQATISS